MVRLVLATSFLITGQDKIIEPDILSKDMQKFISTDDESEIKRLHERATRRRGEGTGYTIGRRERLIDLARKRHAELEEAEGETKSLQYQHQRCGHIHRFKTKDGYIAKWIPQLTVRPDLPLPPKSEQGRGGLIRGKLQS